MQLPRNNFELTKIFKNARVPEISEFNGEYYVDMLTVLPSLKGFSHRKFFYSQNNKILGYNILFTKKLWGHFFLEEGICREVDSSRVIIINYDRRENSFISNKIRDYVKSADANTLYIGMFNYIFMGKPKFLGFFSLSKIK